MPQDSTTFHTDYAEVRRRCVEFVERVVDDADAEGVVVGLSGGVDSTVSAHLAVRAVGADRVAAYSFPASANSYGNMRDAEEVADRLNVEFRSVSLQPAVEVVDDTVEMTSGQELSGDERKQVEGNAAARLRMTLLYSQADLQSKLVLGTGNRSEMLLGYFTKHGDGGVDLLPIGDLYKTEIRGLAEHLGVPDKIVEKSPTAGLWDGQDDESELGLPYETLDEVLNLYVDRQRSVGDVAQEVGVDVEDVERLVEMVEDNEHKRTPPPSPLTYGVRRKMRPVEVEEGTGDVDDGSLDESQLRRVTEMLSEPPAVAGYDARRWTPEIVVDYVRRTFGTAYSEDRVRRLLDGLGHETAGVPDLD